MKTGLTFIIILLCQLSAFAQPKTRQVIVEGRGPAIVFLHGGTFDIHSFEPHARLLSDSFTILRMQQFNVQYGDAGQLLPRDYSVKMESEAVNATLDSLGIQEPVIVVGHSYGGLIAFDFAMRHSARIKALVLIEAPLFGLAKARHRFSDEMKAIDELTSQFRPQAEITEEMVRRFRCKMAGCDTADIRQHPMWPKWLQQKNRLRGLSVVPKYKIDFKKLHAFNKPVLIITGSTTVEAHRIINELLSLEFSNAATATITGDHVAIYKNAADFTQVLGNFIRNKTTGIPVPAN